MHCIDDPRLTRRAAKELGYCAECYSCIKADDDGDNDEEDE